MFALKACGHTDRTISELTGVPINTIRQWRKQRLSARIRRSLADSACDTCGAGRHDFASVPCKPYSYLLGVYLGDGCLTRWGGSWTFRVSLDDLYPGIVATAARQSSRSGRAGPGSGPSDALSVASTLNRGGLSGRASFLSMDLDESTTERSSYLNGNR